jgi:hypothetical protein
LLPRSLLSFRRSDDAIVPDYLGPQDFPWIRAMLDVYIRFEGKTFRELDHRLVEPLSPEPPRPKKKRVAAVLHRLFRERSPRSHRPRQLREALFVAAASQPLNRRDETIADVAGSLELSPTELERLLFADLPGQRRVARPQPEPTPLSVTLEANLALAKGLVARSVGVEIELRGNARAVVKLARLRGLICVVARPEQTDADIALNISGPLALFRRTTVYGRALAALVGVLPWCERFRLRARCALDGEVVPVEIRSGDPLALSDEPRRFDSRLEERLFRDLGRAAPDWEIIREPEPIQLPGHMIFPDFALEHRRDRRRWILEIVGFWTRDYLDQKLASLAAAKLDNLIVCVDAARGCDENDLPASSHLVSYKRRIDPADVLAIIEPDQKPGGRSDRSANIL